MSEPGNNLSQPADAGVSQANAPLFSSQAVTPRPIFMPETFTGIGREWSDWADQFEMAADVNNWDESLKLKFMGLLLSGRGREVYSGLSALDKGACTEGQMPAPPCASAVAPDSSKGGSGYLKAKIGGLDSHVLVDTGASRSIIPKRLWLSATGGGCDLGDYLGNATAANGGEMHVLGCWQTVCQLDSLALVADFLVSDIPSEEILLGFDFLSKYGAVVDLGKKQCHIMGKQFHLVDLNPSLEPQPVVIQSDTMQSQSRCTPEGSPSTCS
uniref:Peptidase A2 domain-containing protein n=1 Tax=Myripristis murdjan TaxID=586833 RepID=A0A667X1Q3_9TELE